MRRWCWFIKRRSTAFEGWREQRYYPWFDMEAQAPHENVPIRSHDRHILKLDIFTLKDLSTTAED
jgi:hypothetical protein